MNKFDNETMITQLRDLIIGKDFDNASKFGEKLLTMTNNGCVIFDTALAHFYNKDYEKSYTLLDRYMHTVNVDDSKLQIARNTKSFCIPHMRKKTQYPKEKVENTSDGPITVTITSCKRYSLFEKTINSFLNCVNTSLVSRWICVDDNSSEEDRGKMKENYPFFEFYFKDENEKGHAHSMNMIRNLVKTPFFFHLEDDWEFFYTKNYLYDMLQILLENQNIGQVLINRNYAETEKECDLMGGKLCRTSTFQPYYLHVQRECTGRSCEYWPHFSLRPSLIRTSVLNEIGEFNETAGHFEMEYAERYKKKYSSAFLMDVYSIHIGRLCSERHSTEKNAYDLNQTTQFGNKQNVYVINLKRRPDRWEKFNRNILRGLNVHRVEAVDGKEITLNEQLTRIFNENDYNWRKGIIGCTLSHFQLYIDLLDSQDEYRIILEDDAELCEGFFEKLTSLLSTKDRPWDLLYLGHYPRSPITSTVFTAVKKTGNESLQYSYGGTIGYIITKEGANKLLDFIEKVGMKNAIDTMQQRAADVMEVYYTEPLLVKGECFDQNKNVDSDIQKDGDCFTVNGMQRVQGHIQFYQSLGWPVTPYDGYFTDDWKEDEVLVCQQQIIENKENNLMIYNVDQTTFVVPDRLRITGEIVNKVQPYKFKRFVNDEMIWKIEY